MHYIIGILSFILFSLAPGICDAADWEYFMQDNKGDSHYIDLESIRHTPEGTAKIVKKVEPGKKTDYASHITELEMDCKANRIRVIKQTAVMNDGKKKSLNTDGKWQKIAPEDLDELLLELVCSLKKSAQ